jgi:cell division septal protein FtsQ
MPRRKKNQDVSLYIKIFTISFVIVLSTLMGFLVWKHSVSYLYAASDFQVKSVYVDPNLHFIREEDKTRLYGMNIFNVDLEGVQNMLLYKYPQIDDVKVTRKFPDTISFVAKRRDPIAQFIYDGKTVTIDEKGYVISLKSKLDPKLTFVQNLNYDQQPVLGLPYLNERLRLTLDVILNFIHERDLSEYELVTIDASNPTKVLAKVSNGVDIILDQYHLEKKMAVLGFVLNEGDLNYDEVAYIDLRFKEPVIGKTK